MIYRVQTGVLFRITEKGTVVIMTGAGQEFFWEITGAAAHLWRGLDGKKTWERIKAGTAAKTKLTKTRFDTEAEKFLRQLLEADLIAEVVKARAKKKTTPVRRKLARSKK